MDLVALAKRTNHFVARDSGVMRRVDNVGRSYVSITVLSALQSSYSMPLAEYDATFAERCVPVDMGSLKPAEGYRPPANMTAWASPAEPPSDLDPARGETPTGVTIGGGLDSPPLA